MTNKERKHRTALGEADRAYKKCGDDLMIAANRKRAALKELFDAMVAENEVVKRYQKAATRLVKVRGGS